jgi:hypothetical protein
MARQVSVDGTEVIDRVESELMAVKRIEIARFLGHNMCDSKKAKKYTFSFGAIDRINYGKLNPESIV